MSPVSAIGWFSTSWLQVGMISAIAPFSSWLLAGATFIAFAGFSLYQGVIGQSSCGCFGRFSVSPWYSFTLDIAIIFALAFARPSATPAAFSVAMRQIASVVGGIVLITSLLGISAHIAFGSFPKAIAFFRGEAMSVEPTLVDVGESPAGHTSEVVVSVTNWTDDPIPVYGGTSDCSCSVLGDLPITVPGNEARSVSIRVNFKGSEGLFTRKIAFLIDNAEMRRVEFAMTGRVTSAPKVAEKGYH